MYLLLRDLKVVLMLDILKNLVKIVDTVVVVGEPNTRFLLRIGLGEAAVVYRGSTEDCKVVAPLRDSKKVEKILPSSCTPIWYSYDVQQVHGYVIARSMTDVLIGVLKSVVKQGEDIGIPLIYTDPLTFLALSRYWKVRDLSNDLRILRSKKNEEVVKDLVNMHTFVKDVVTRCRADAQDVVSCLMKNFEQFFDRIEFRFLTKTSDVIALQLTVDKQPYILSYRWSIPLGKQAEEMILRVDEVLEKAVQNYSPRFCLDLVKHIKNQVQRQGLKVSIDLCGVGTELCEYPLLNECLYEDVVVEDGMVMKIETVVNEAIYVPKILFIRNKKVEVH